LRKTQNDGFLSDSVGEFAEWNLNFCVLCWIFTLFQAIIKIPK
jgi:hypothetical protein